VGQLDGGHPGTVNPSLARGFILLPFALVLLFAISLAGLVVVAGILMALRFFRMAPIYDATPSIQIQIRRNRPQSLCHATIVVLARCSYQSRRNDAATKDTWRVHCAGVICYLLFGSVIGSGILLRRLILRRWADPRISLPWVLGGVLRCWSVDLRREAAAANPEPGGLYCYIRDGSGGCGISVWLSLF
jgi:hypothetical protein